ncbi:MAG: tyrosine--tRNA ligase [Pirellulaceae bacterium]
MPADIFAELSWRGLVYQSTDETGLQAWLNQGQRVVYAGFDPTADSLHIGSLLPLVMLRRFQKAGHKPIALAGGATGMIGDPSGKSAERNLLDEEKIAHNLSCIQNQLSLILDFEPGDNQAVLVNNADWTGKFSYIEFLRDVGKNFSVNVMLAKDSVKSRIEGDVGISYTEFSYMLLQAYDFVHLNRAFGCELQIGGSDQWGNITAGIDLGRRMNSAQLYGLTCPLLTKSDGSKMGKTETGTIWLDGQKTSPYQFYQYLVTLADDDVGKCLRFLTDLPQEEIVALDQSRQEQPHLRESQKRLAEEMTRMLHGEDGFGKALNATEIFFGAEIENLTDSELSQIFTDVPSVASARDGLGGEGLALIDAMTMVGIAKSKGEARRAIGEGGAYVNNRRVGEVEYRLKETDLASESFIVLRRGRNATTLTQIRVALTAFLELWRLLPSKKTDCPNKYWTLEFGFLFDCLENSGIR